MNQIAYDQPSASPTPKVTAAGIGGAIAVLLVFVAGQFGIDVTAEAAAAITTLLAFLSGYVKKDTVPQEMISEVISKETK